jgi:hypothetical protein
MKVGDLVTYQEKYWHPDMSERPPGLVLTVDPPDSGPCPIRVRWSNHNSSQRDWYAEEELTKIKRFFS